VARRPEAVTADVRTGGAAGPVTTSGRASAALRVRDLWKRYGADEAVRGISFEVAEGEIFGLIGPDGAGKTSTFQILAGVMEASAGVAEVFDRPAREARSETGYLTQSFSLYPDLTVAENLRYAGDLRRVPRAAIAERGGRYLEMFDLTRFVDRLAGKLSGGMKQKLSLACALVAEWRLLTSRPPARHPVSRRGIWDALAHLAAGGPSVRVATPYLTRPGDAGGPHPPGRAAPGRDARRATPGPWRPARRGPHGRSGRGRARAVGDRGPRPGDRRRPALR
jgi:ABC-2 type transport system ATP-binding protein